MIDSFTTWLRRPHVWIIAAATAGLVGLALGNGWLTAGALLSVLVALAPCLLMCALGLCMRQGSGEGCQHTTERSDKTASTLTSKEL